MNPVSSLLDLVAPRACFVCRAQLDNRTAQICRPCFLALPWWRQADGCPKCGTALFSRSRESLPGSKPGGRLEPSGCPHCLATGSALHLCRAATRYVGDLCLWIPALKNTRGALGPSAEVRNAIRFLAQSLAAQIAAESEARPDLILPIPLHPSRSLRRGFNHADLIASHVAKGLGCPWHPGVLRRIRATRSQARLVGEARRKNMRGAFRLRKPLGDARNIWLVDDVLTTGSTLEAAAEALLDAGAEEVRALTLARDAPSSPLPSEIAAKAPASTYHSAALPPARSPGSRS